MAIVHLLAILIVVLHVDRLQTLEVLPDLVVASQLKVEVVESAHRLIDHALDDAVNLQAVPPLVFKVVAPIFIDDEDLVLDGGNVRQMA